MAAVKPEIASISTIRKEKQHIDVRNGLYEMQQQSFISD